MVLKQVLKNILFFFEKIIKKVVDKAFGMVYYIRAIGNDLLTKNKTKERKEK